MRCVVCVCVCVCGMRYAVCVFVLDTVPEIVTSAIAILMLMIGMRSISTPMMCRKGRVADSDQYYENVLKEVPAVAYLEMVAIVA